MDIRAKYEQLREIIDDGSESMTHDEAVAELSEIAKLRAELEAARVDAERYQWIKDNVRKQYSVWWINGISARTGPTDFEVAIDAARGKS